MKKKILKNSIFIMFVLTLLFLLNGCSTKDYTLSFATDMILDYKSNDSPLVLIQKIGDIEITDKMIKNKKIEIDNFSVECEALDTSKVGAFEVKYITNDTENRYYTKRVFVKDISSPVIEVKEDKISLTLEEYKNFDFTKIITITDNWDEAEPLVNLTVDEIKSSGNYTIKISAEDLAGNRSEKKITLTIKEDEKSNESSPKNEENETIANPVYPNVQPTQPSQNQIPVQPPVTKPSNKDFLFSDGYTMDNVGSVCFNALQSSGASGTCIPIKDANGIYIGMRLTFN